MNAVVFKDVWEKYRLRFKRDRHALTEDIWVLRGVNLSVPRGQILGIVGENGAGKTTLLKLAAGMLFCDKGRVDVQGKVAALMELGAGFDREFTGRQNILMNAQTYGFRKEALDRCIREVEAFADLGRFMDAPVKCYSQGMFMRLAFALSVFVEPDIFLIDDILSVGDEMSQRKCINKIFELKKSGKTMVIVSHDMHLLRQLCDRVIFFQDGRIVADGEPDEIISYYIEGVGNKEGIGILEKDCARLTFNNGNVSLRYKGSPLTVSPGAYVSMYIPDLNHWCPSHVFQWSIKERSDDRIVAHGVYGKNLMSLEWVLGLEKNGFYWEIQVEGGSVREAHVDMVFVPDYTRYRTSSTEEDFPGFAHKNEWQSLSSQDPVSGIMGLIPARKAKKPKLLPRVLFTQGKEDVPMALFNSGYELEGRVAQFFFSKRRSLSLKLEFVQEQSAWESLWEERAFELPARVASGQMWKLKDQMALSGDFGIVADGQRKLMRIFYGDKEITASGGFRGMIETESGSFNFGNADWSTKISADGNLMLKLDFKDHGAVQEWSFSPVSPGVFSVKAVLDTKKPLKVVKQFLSLELKDIYKRWKTAFEEGELEAHCDFAHVYPIRWKNSKVSSVGIYKNKDSVPALSFLVSSDPGGRIMNLHRRKEGKHESVCLVNSLIVPFQSIGYGPGRRVFFEGKLSLQSCEPDFTAEVQAGITAKLETGKFSFVFDSGRGRIFSGGRELTKDLGLYTSLRSQGIWMDSSQASWHVAEKTPNKIVAVGSWPFVPIEERWEIGLRKEGRFSFDVTVEIFKDTTIEIEQAGIMLSDSFKHWQVDGHNQGDFPKEYTTSYDILPYSSWYGSASEISASGEGSVKMTLVRDDDLDFLRALIENSDNIYRARLLLFQKANEGSLKQGKYKLFKGEIRLEK